jgi:hypothetical protein
LSGALIICIILKLPKIANEAYPTDISWLSRVYVHDPIIKSDEKENERFRWLAFPLEGQIHFPLHLFTLHGILGENQQ